MTDSGHQRGLEYRGVVIGNVVVTVNEMLFHCMSLHKPAINAEVMQAVSFQQVGSQRHKLKPRIKGKRAYPILTSDLVVFLIITNWRNGF